MEELTTIQQEALKKKKLLEEAHKRNLTLKDYQ